MHAPVLVLFSVQYSNLIKLTGRFWFRPGEFHRDRAIGHQLEAEEIHVAKSRPPNFCRELLHFSLFFNLFRDGGN
jgi:hypothetical protein